MRNSRSFCFSIILVVIMFGFAGCSKDPDLRAQKYFNSGQKLFERGEFEKARIEFRNALNVRPAYADAHYYLGLSYLKLQQWARANQELSRVIELRPDNYAARIELARLLVASGNVADAQQQANWLLENRFNDAKSHLVAANLLSVQAHFSQAEQEMEKGIALDPSDGELYLNLALIQLKSNQPEPAETSFKKAIEVSPSAIAPRVMLADFYQVRGRFDEGEQQLRSAMQIDPDDPEPTAALARLLLAENRKPDAETLLIQAKDHFPRSSVGYRMLADFYLSTNDVDKAVVEYRNLYRGHPKDLQVKKNYTEVLIRTNRLEEAKKVDREILTDYPQDSDALVYQGEIDLHGGNVSDAIDTLQRVIKNDPKNGLAHYQLGLALQRSGDTAEAENELRSAVQVDPKLAEAQRELALVAMRKGDMTTLDQASTQLISLRSMLPDGYALRAVSEINRKQFRAAEADASKAIVVSPANAAGYVQMGNLNFAQSHFKEAQDSYREALGRDPRSNDALRGLMNSYVALSQTEGAIAAAEVQIAKVHDVTGFYDLLGTVLFEQKKDLKDAEAAFTKAVELDRNNTDALIKLGEVQSADGRSEEAIATYQRALHDNPREANFYVLLGELFQAKHDWSKAQEWYQKALEFRQNDPIVSGNLAAIMVEDGGNLDVALSLAETARRELPDSPSAADTLGWVYYQKGAYLPAIESLRAAVKLAQTNDSATKARFHYHLGMAYAKNGQSALAKRELEKVLRMNPSESEVRDTRKQLAQMQL